MTDLTLQIESNIYVNDKGERIPYITTFVLVNGIRVVLVPKDGTAKQILASLAEN